ncbi:hypothetical protein Tco_0747806 [Tanacetum coccineum]|uniref:Uncharacterized protein n=1 Tax=Tanacetum coccineum TaxID=301880 RepID=A0ABQ4YWD2_9ASTR
MKSDTTSSSAGSHSQDLSNVLQAKFRRKREVAKSAYEVKMQKDRTLMQCEELEFHTLDVRKCVGIPIPNVLDSPSGYGYSPDGYTRIGFGVCPDANDPKLVKINVVQTPSICWEVQIGKFNFFGGGEGE